MSSNRYEISDHDKKRILPIGLLLIGMFSCVLGADLVFDFIPSYYGSAKPMIYSIRLTSVLFHLLAFAIARHVRTGFFIDMLLHLLLGALMYVDALHFNYLTAMRDAHFLSNAFGSSGIAIPILWSVMAGAYSSNQ